MSTANPGPCPTLSRPRSMGWRLRLLIALLLVVGYAICFFIIPKIEASWNAKTPAPKWCDLRLMPSVKVVSGIPTTGDDLVIVADVDHVLHFRIFDGHGKIVVDTDEKKLTGQARRIDELRKQLEDLWPPQKPTQSERVQVNASVASIAGYTWPQLPRWVIVLTSCSHWLVRYVPRILFVGIAWILLRRWFLARKVKPRRLQLGLGTALVAVAVLAVAIARLNAWLLAPYQAEQHAAAALTQLGGKVVMVDHAPRWLRYFVGKDLFNMEVASVVDLSHSRVTDSDLAYLAAFRHCGLVNLADTQVSNAGLTHLSKMVGGQWLDLSRTRVTDVSVLFGSGSVNFVDHVSSLKLAGNRIARVEMPRRRWSPLFVLDLSDTDADDGTLASLSDGLVNLFDLNLSGTKVSDDGLSSLLRMEGLSKLNLIDTQVTAAGVARLKSRWRYRRPLTIFTGTRKQAGGAPNKPPPPGSSARPIPVRLEGDVPAPGSGQPGFPDRPNP
jgi:hypothetical protein